MAEPLWVVVLEWDASAEIEPFGPYESEAEADAAMERFANQHAEQLDSGELSILPLQVQSEKRGS